MLSVGWALFCINFEFYGVLLILDILGIFLYLIRHLAEVNLLLLWRNIGIQSSLFFCTIKWRLYSSTDSCRVLLFFDIQIESCWREVLIIVPLYGRILLNIILKILLRYWRLLVLSCSLTVPATWYLWFFIIRFPLIIGLGLTPWSWVIRKCRMCFIW